MSNNYINDSQASEIVKFISDTMKLPIMGAGGGFAPIGTINFFDASVAPQGWLACDGTTYNIADYPDLATYYASVHGSSNFYGGDGTTTFAVPDLRGEFLRGTGTNSHENQGNGSNVGVHQDGTEHLAMYTMNTNKLYYPFTEFDDNADRKFDNTKGTNKLAYGNLAGSSSGASFPQEYTSRPTNTSFLICVKATVAGDSNGHVYSTEEQVVGTWIDGKPIYERVYRNVNLETSFNQNVGAGEATLTDSSLANIDVLIDCRFIGEQLKNSGITVCNSVNAQHRTSNTLFIRTPSDNNYIQHIIIQYTKTTDQWQTS